MKGKGKPLGKSQRGKQRKFTNFEELQSQAEKLAKKKEQGDEETSEEEDSDEVDKEEEEEEDSEEETSSDEDHKPKGVESLIDIENPNRRPKKSAVAGPGTPAASAGPKPQASASAPKPELSRREKEEIERQRRAVASISLKSEQARADMARLALIKAEREQAAKKRELAKQIAAAAAKKP